MNSSAVRKSSFIRIGFSCFQLQLCDAVWEMRKIYILIILPPLSLCELMEKVPAIYREGERAFKDEQSFQMKNYLRNYCCSTLDGAFSTRDNVMRICLRERASFKAFSRSFSNHNSPRQASPVDSGFSFTKIINQDSKLVFFFPLGFVHKKAATSHRQTPRLRL